MNKNLKSDSWLLKNAENWKKVFKKPNYSMKLGNTWKNSCKNDLICKEKQEIKEITEKLSKERGKLEEDQKSPN